MSATRTTQRRPRFVTALTAAVAAIGIAGAGCGTSGESSGAASKLTPREALVESLHNEHDEASFLRPYATVSEMLPNTSHQIRGQANPVTVFETVVVGRITAVENGDGFIEATGPAEASQLAGGPLKTTFDNPLAWWRTLRLTVDVERNIAGEAPDPLVVDWSILGSSAKGDDAAAVATGLRQLGTVVLFLDRSPAATAPSGLGLFDRLYGVATVDPRGRLGFPFVDADKAGPFANGVVTVDDLAREAAKPARTKPAS